MLLAGGSGIRLLPLTKEVAKPIVSYGGKYKIIDFVFSNLINSQINKVGILIQNNQTSLDDYIENGSYWGFNINDFHILKPKTFYRNTANAVYQNINFIKKHNPKYVLVVSGDHIYNMNYQKVIKFHEQKNADCTIAVKNVSLQDANRFGIMSTNENHKIIKFDEKPKYPKSTLASMGIYLFNTDFLLKYLIEDENDPKSDNDFGKNIIPKIVKCAKVYAYTFDGYWKDVGTLNSLWEANMAILNNDVNFQNIYTKENVNCSFVNEKNILNSYIASGSTIEGIVINSIISKNVIVRKGALIKNSIIMDNSIIGEKVIIDYAIISENVVISKNNIIGSENALTVIGNDVNINYHIKAGMVIAKN